MAHLIPHLSVVIPTFNRKQQVEKAIVSALRQSESSPFTFEILVSDDGSSDGTIPYLRSRFKEEVQSGKLRLFPFPHTGDPARARNQAVRSSQAEWLAFLDSDDAWGLNHFSRAHPYMERTDFIAGVVDTLDEGAETNLLRSFLKMNLAATSASFIRRSLFEQAGGFPEYFFGSASSRIPGFEDYSLWLSALAILENEGLSGRAALLPTPDLSRETFSDGAGRMRLSAQMKREFWTILRALPKIPLDARPMAIRRMFGALKGMVVGKWARKWSPPFGRGDAQF